MQRIRPLSAISQSLSAHGRRGLAPLELVLSLPILLFVMALMIIMGTAGGWKVRTEANARQAAWRSLWPRTGQNDPNPLGWPTNATMSYSTTNPPLMSTDPFAEFAALRGPMLSEPSGQFLPVNTSLLDSTFGMKDGFARIQRSFPMLANMPPRRIDLPQDHIILDGTLWQYPTMGIPDNVTRRILFLYDFQLQARAPELTDLYGQAALAIIQNPKIPDLTPLEGGDPEVIQLLGQVSPDFVRQYSINVEYRATKIPQVRSSVPNYCQTDIGTVKSDKVDPYKRTVERTIPRQMSNYYINVYTQVKQQLEMQMPPPPGAQQQIAALQKKIDQLNQFKATIPPGG